MTFLLSLAWTVNLNLLSSPSLSGLFVLKCMHPFYDSQGLCKKDQQVVWMNAIMKTVGLKRGLLMKVCVTSAVAGREGRAGVKG